MCLGMDCVRETTEGCPFIKGSLKKTQHALKKAAEMAADSTGKCFPGRNNPNFIPGASVIHTGCPRVKKEKGA